MHINCNDKTTTSDMKTTNQHNFQPENCCRKTTWNVHTQILGCVKHYLTTKKNNKTWNPFKNIQNVSGVCQKHVTRDVELRGWKYKLWKSLHCFLFHFWSKSSHRYAQQFIYDYEINLKILRSKSEWGLSLHWIRRRQMIGGGK